MWIDNVTLEVSLGFGSGPFATSPTWTNVTTDVRSLDIQRGRQSVRSVFSAGTARIVLDNTSGDYSPNNTSGPHYPDVTLGVPVRIRATYNVTTYDVFYGYVTRLPLVFQDPNEARVMMEATEQYALLHGYYLVAQTYAEQSSELTLGDIADDAGWPTAWRNFDTGVTDVAGITYTGAAGALIDNIAHAEQGTLFQARDGKLTFYNRTHYDGATKLLTWGSAGYPIANAMFEYGSDYFVNRAAITGADNVTATATEAVSLNANGPSPWQNGTISNPLLISEPYSQNVAEWMVERYSGIRMGVRAFDVYPELFPSNLYPKILGSDTELGAFEEVTYTPPAGSTITQEVRVERIRHRITPGHWVTTLGVYPADAIETETDWWILGEAGSQLGTTTRLA